MLLEKLTISSKNGVIRDIPFKLQGMNLIIDSTANSPDDQVVSGNNVGKTTFIRCIDFCFGSSGKDIYQDKETKNDNNEVRSFLFENEVSFTLSLLKKDLSRLTLKRSFKKEEDLYINDEKIKDLKTYCGILNDLIFHISRDEKKISFRNIIKKFVRCDDSSENNIYKILHGTVKDNVYEALYLKLFGFPDEKILSERLKASTKIQSLENELKNIKGKSSLPKLTTRLVQLQQLIDEKETQNKNFNLPVTYDKIVTQLREIKARTAGLSSSLGTLNTKISLSEKTRDELSHSESKIDPIAIKELYDEAKHLIPDVQKQFEEVLTFHNKMIANKIKFVEQHINSLELERKITKGKLDELLTEQSRILQLLDNTGTFDDLVKVREEVNQLYIEKGKLVSQIEKITQIQTEILEFKLKLDEINLLFEAFKEDLNNNIQHTFNKYFKNYTAQTHGEQLYIYYDSESQKFEFDNIEGNVGDGYKKTEVIAFDLAFISFFNEIGLDFPLFVIHDKLEIVHRNQIQTTFNIADSLSGQFIVSVLKERISFLGEDYIENKTILELSQEKKFFKF